MNRFEIADLSPDENYDRREFLRTLGLAAAGLWTTSALGQGLRGGVEASVARQRTLVSRAGHVRIMLGGGLRAATVTALSTLRIVSEGGSSRATAGRIITATAGGGSASVSVDGRVVAQGSTVQLVPEASAAEGAFQFNGGRYRGELHLVARGGSLNAINDLFIDDWLKGLLGAEIGDDAPLESLKAQAVAARSEACFKLLSPPHASNGYDFCNGPHCQAYKGMKEESAATIQACDATAGLILSAGGDILDAVYHNVCGGATALPVDVWDTKPSPGYTVIRDGQNARLGSLADDAAVMRFLQSPGAGIFCDGNNAGYPRYAQKYYRWQSPRSAGQLEGAFGVGRIRQLVVSDRRASGRVRKLTAVGDRGTRTIEKELPIRNALNLWSGFFAVVPTMSGGYVSGANFVGGGNGHGVGLCQMGARIMAAQGYTFAQILRHYYPEASVERLYRS